MPTEEGSKAIHTGALKSISRQTRRINSQYEILYVNSREVVNGSVQSLGEKIDEQALRGSVLREQCVQHS